MDIDRIKLIIILEEKDFDCFICNKSFMKGVNAMCDDCDELWKFGHRTNKGNKRFSTRTRTIPGPRIRECGIPADYGPERISYFLSHPELNFQFPPIPQADIIANPGKKLMWHLDHIDGIYWNNAPWNLNLILNTEHASKTASDRKRDNYWKELMIKILKEGC